VNAIAPAARNAHDRVHAGTVGLRREALRRRRLRCVDPANISPSVATLAMEDCAATGQVFFVQGGTIRRFQNWTMTTTLEKDDRWSVSELAAQLPTLY